MYRYKHQFPLFYTRCIRICFVRTGRLVSGSRTVRFGLSNLREFSLTYYIYIRNPKPSSPRKLDLKIFIFLSIYHCYLVREKPCAVNFHLAARFQLTMKPRARSIDKESCSWSTKYEMQTSSRKICVKSSVNCRASSFPEYESRYSTCSDSSGRRRDRGRPVRMGLDYIEPRGIYAYLIHTYLDTHKPLGSLILK